MDTNKKLYRAKPFLPKEDRLWIEQAWREILDTRSTVYNQFI